ncbi:ribonucleoside-diphosphate reductase [Pseudomonas phage LUZ100]|nr:ribonucleoside-diphosphate reductase [Pseudomonas phage LUZ100]
MHLETYHGLTLDNGRDARLTALAGDLLRGFYLSGGENDPRSITTQSWRTGKKLIGITYGSTTCDS